MALVATAAIAGTAAATAYLNGKYQLGKDIRTIHMLKQAERAYIQACKEDRLSLWYFLANVNQKYPDELAIWSRSGCFTFAELHDHAARYAQWFLEQGVRPGELVALYLTNSPYFMIVWFALTAIGAAPAFINFNLQGQALVHCLGICQPPLILVDQDPDCQSRIEGSREQITAKGMKIVVLDDGLKRKVASTPAVVPSDKYRKGWTGDFPACLIYTSGTTGLPKASAFTTSRLWLIGSYLHPNFDSKPGIDRWYSSMPLYHGTGSMASISQLIGGVGIAIAPKFSVSGFWPDIHDSKSTAFIYVGETARYLLNAPVHPLEKKHSLRVAYGNGLRPDVWEKFRERFNIPEIAEFFNSTEGVFALLNWNRGPYQSACVGHHGLIFRRMLQNVYVPVKVDHDTGDIWRDPKTGFAQRMPYEEGGEMLVAIPNKKAFQGYWRSESATEKKFCQNVFKEGDLYYRSGDALRRNSDGKWYFLDRLGDTYRWKSENVSTAEVAECLGKYPGIAEANVYGVLVPNHEGRAGCAAVHLDPNYQGTVDFNQMLEYSKARLPKYAVPVFIRIVNASTHIHNHKQNKVPLRKEGVDPKLIGTEAPEGKDDQFLWLPPKENGYVPFEKSHWEQLKAGQARL